VGQLHLTHISEIPSSKVFIVTTNNSSTQMGNMYGQCFGKTSCVINLIILH